VKQTKALSTEDLRLNDEAPTRSRKFGKPTHIGGAQYPKGTNMRKT